MSNTTITEVNEIGVVPSIDKSRDFRVYSDGDDVYLLL